MKKSVFLLAFIVSSISLFAQSDKLPKIRYSSGFFSTKYEIGDKDVKQKDILLHLEKNNTAAYYEFKRGSALGVQSIVWGIVGLAGFSVGTFSSSNEAKVIGYGSAAVGFSVELVTLIISQKKLEKGIDIYNQDNGY